MTLAPGPHSIQPVRHNAIYWAVADGLVLAKRNLLQIPRMPQILVFTIIQPAILVLLFRFVFGGAIHIRGTSYINYLMAGIFVQTVITGSAATGVGLAEDLHRGIVDRFRSLPMSPSAVLTGRTLADLVRNMLAILVMLVIGVLVGFRPEATLTGWLGAIGLLLLASFTFSWVAAVVGLAVGNVEAAQSAGFLWLLPLMFASSIFVLTSTMPGWLQPFADYQPVSILVDALRRLVLGEPVGAYGWGAPAWCLGILLVFVPLAVALYRRAAAR
jgi:ABC-2 type transport system permease protein/oleandomycin transport system permease protein